MKEDCNESCILGLAAELGGALQVSDRTKTAEELAELERLRLEALEKQRLRRMTAAASAEGGDADEADAVPAQAAGGYAARRQKRQKLSSEAEADIGPSGMYTFCFFEHRKAPSLTQGSSLATAHASEYAR